MLVIGCDPGLTGALALIHTERGLLDCIDLPSADSGLSSGRMRRWLDLHALQSAMLNWSRRHDFAREFVHAVIERPIPMPSLPASTLATQFETFGALRAVLFQAANAPVNCVAPADWKRIYSFGTDKDGARATCLALYPNAEVARKKDHNRAEAILLAHWLGRKLA